MQIGKPYFSWNFFQPGGAKPDIRGAENLKGKNGSSFAKAAEDME